MCAVHGRADRSSRRDLPRKCSDIHAWSCSPTVRARADAPASMCRPCTLCTRTPLAQDGRQVHTCRAESALDGNSGFDHAVMMSVQTKSRGQCGMRAPLHRCTALPPGSAHAAKGKICLSVKISRRENISFLPDPFRGALFQARFHSGRGRLCRGHTPGSGFGVSRKAPSAMKRGKQDLTKSRQSC